jgi:deoxyribose-phosphate aldolase
LPCEVNDAPNTVIQAVEHTLLRPTASTLDIEKLCAEAKEHGFHAVCVNPQHVALAASCLSDTPVLICSVVGFPLGATDTRALQAEVESVVGHGAGEVDMVVPIGSLCEDDIWTTYQHVAAAVREAHMERDVKVKVILETHYLTYGQIVKGCMVAVAAGADFVKTSTGFAPGGARLADVAIMAMAVEGRLGVKAAGGVKSRAQALNFLRMGANRLGTSNGIALSSEG